MTSACAIDTVPAATPAPTSCQRRSIPRASCSRPCSDRVVARVRGASQAATVGAPSTSATSIAVAITRNRSPSTRSTSLVSRTSTSALSPVAR